MDVKDNFKPKYAIIKGKEKLVSELKEAAAESETVYLATDPDREERAISWHLAYILGLDEHAMNRVTFNEITKTGVTEGMAHTRTIDLNLVNAQQARRIPRPPCRLLAQPVPRQDDPRGLSAWARAVRCAAHHRRPRGGDRKFKPENTGRSTRA